MTEVTPWSAKSDDGFDYDKLIEKFDCFPLSDDLLYRFECVTHKKPHRFLRRGIFFSHKDLDKCLSDYESGKQIYLYTGRGPSHNMHLGHIVPFEFTVYLQEAFNAICIIQLSDDEKYYFKDEESLEYYNELGKDNAKDIIACGFDP